MGKIAYIFLTLHFRRATYANCSLLRRGSMRCYVYPLNEVSAGAKAERVDQAANLCQKHVVFLYIDRFLAHLKFDSFILVGSQHLLCLYSLRSLILKDPSHPLCFARFEGDMRPFSMPSKFKLFTM